LAVDPDGSFTIDGVINFSADGGGIPIEDGNFSEIEDAPDAYFPGLPRSNDATFDFFGNAQNFSIEVLTYLELPARETILGVYHDDAIELAIHPNDARDIFRQRLAGFDSNAGNSDRTALIDVPKAGLYSVRILMAHWNGNASLEFYSADPTDESSLTSINSTSADSIKAWQRLNIEGRPYLTSVTPSINATGVAKDTPIQVTMRLAGDTEAVMKVNGAEATIEKSADGDNTIFTHTPTVPFELGQAVTVELTYGEATSTWTFVTFSGSKALLITDGGQLNGASTV
jgi:hypothetical protein